MSNMRFCTVSFNRPNNSVIVRIMKNNSDGSFEYVDDSEFFISADDLVHIELLGRLNEIENLGYEIHFLP